MSFQKQPSEVNACVTVIPRLYYLSALTSVRKWPLVFFRAFQTRSGGTQRSEAAPAVCTCWPVLLRQRTDSEQPLIGKVQYSRLHVHIENTHIFTVIMGYQSRCDRHLCTAVQLFVAKISKVCDTPLRVAAAAVLLLVFLGLKRFSIKTITGSKF